MFFKKQHGASGFNAKTVDFLVEHKRLTKISVKRRDFHSIRRGYKIILYTASTLER
jgi:hypothetical protein